MNKSRFSSLVATLMLIPKWFVWGSPLKSDEELHLFPVAAEPLEPGIWQVELKGWVFEREAGSIWRKLATFSGGEALELLGVSEEDAHDPRFRERFSWFLVDNERNKRIILRIADQRVVSDRSGANGHMAFPPLRVTGDAAEWVPVSVESPLSQHAHIRGHFQLVPEFGTTVISDIDDTVKISEVLDRKALVRNIFAHPYEPTDGMPELYGDIAASGAFFHYLSASPWQLYSELQSFLDTHYPAGTLSLRHFRLGDKSFWDFFHSSMDYKLAEIRDRIRRFPKHRFILIGDSGERDPEVYAQIQMEFPRNVGRVLIRRVANSDVSDERLQRVFGGMPEDVWQLFDNPEEISRKLLSI